MLSRIKSSRVFLYVILITIALLIFIYYLLSDKASKVIVNQTGSAVNSIVECVSNTAKVIVEEVDLDAIKTIVPDAKFADIIIT